MNREDARKNAEVMLAYADGKTIQWRHRGKIGVSWDTMDDRFLGAAFNFSNFEYSVKPEPIKIRIAYVPGTSNVGLVDPSVTLEHLKRNVYWGSETKIHEIELPTD